jgi:hypothetical protein
MMIGTAGIKNKSVQIPKRPDGLASRLIRR